MKAFRDLFAGRSDCFGTYHLPKDIKDRVDGKKKGKGTTHREPLTDKQWEDHLEGRVMLGVVPVLPTGVCNWVVIDVDVYDLNIPELVKKAEKLELPLCICRSKSGGAHCFAFFNSPVDAGEAIKLAKNWAGELGYATAEVFPKQANAIDVGNWLNLPYFNGDKTDRYLIDADGNKLSLSEFEAYANARLIYEKDFEQLKKTKGPSKDDKERKGAPPCLLYFMDNPIGEGGRNNLLCHFAVFFKKCDPDNWADRVRDANRSYFDDPLPDDEVNQIIRNYTRGTYTYKCDNEPMCSRCDKDLCLTKKYGIGKDVDLGFKIDGITKIDTDPPVWIVTINGHYKLTLSTESLLNGRAFRKAVVEKTNHIMPILKDTVWEKIIRPVMDERCTIEAAPAEISLTGRVKQEFYNWVKVYIERSANKSRDNILKGNPFYDVEAKTVIFQGASFLKYFKKEVAVAVTDREVWAALREIDCTATTELIGGEKIPVWVFVVDVPWFEIKADTF